MQTARACEDWHSKGRASGKCVAYTFRRWCALASPCKGKMAGREAQWRRVQRGFHHEADAKKCDETRQANASAQDGTNQHDANEWDDA
eukprot:1493893-Amphidinium_carterae.1